ncbi:MAG TPA: riboflavin synthase, partial [Tepidisphaeraceae bacterium]|nr:riboflavin synthase [Tepidisphaeraceae bacterium]
APWADHVLGESTAINGVCLTVAQMFDAEGTPALAYDVIRETLEKTNLGGLRGGDVVHIERSLRVGDPVDGHVVQGHVDGVGKLVKQTATAEEWRLRVAPPAALAKYLVPKGSVAIDGVSLTLAEVTSEWFEVALIPTTLGLTNLGKHDVGYGFNLECDSTAKTIVTYLERMNIAGNHLR